MNPFGDRLRQARETKGLSLESIAEATRVPRRHLSALERGDLDALPPGPFVTGYIRAYAEHLGVDPQPLLEGYRSEDRRRGGGTVDARDKVIEEMSHIVAQRSGTSGRSGFRPGPKGIVAALVGALAFGVAGWVVSRGPDRGAVGDGRPSAPATVAPRGDAAPPSGGPVESRPARTAGAGGASTAPATRSAPPVTGSAPPPSRTVPDSSSRAPRPQPRAPSSLEVTDSGVGTDVRNHRLVGRADRFTPGAGVVFWTRVVGGRPGDAIRHVWFYEGRAVMRADLEIGGSRWRTYSRLDLPERAIGSWAVETRSPDGRLLAREEFQCVREVQ